MTPIKISRIDLDPLEFDGELLVRSLSEADDDGRHYVISVYAMEADGVATYVPAIEYISEVATEGSFTIAEIVEDAADVEKFFYVFEPLEHLQCKHIDAMSTKARQAFTRQLFRLYDAAIATVLGKFQSHTATLEPKTSTNSTQI